MEINDNKLPKRKPKKTFRSVTGYFPSKKNGRSIFFESILEKRLFLTLEFDKTVTSYLEQPVKIEYKLPNRNTSYHPDCLIHYINDKSKIVEVKYSSDLVEKEDEYKIKFDKAREYANSHDMEFGIFTEQDDDNQTVKNMEFLYAFAFTEKSEDKEYKITDMLAQNKEISVTDLLSLLSENRYTQAEYLPYIWKMVFKNRIYIDIQLIQINMNSLIRLNDE